MPRERVCVYRMVWAKIKSCGHVEFLSRFGCMALWETFGISVQGGNLDSKLSEILYKKLDPF